MYGLSTPCRLIIRNSAIRLFHHDLFNMGDLHLVLHALNLSTLHAGILIMMQHERLMMFSLVDYPMSFLSLSTSVFIWWTSRGDHSRTFLLFEFCCLTPPFCLKVRVVGGLQHCSVSPSPLWSLNFLGLSWGWASGI